MGGGGVKDTQGKGKEVFIDHGIRLYFILSDDDFEINSNITVSL